MKAGATALWILLAASGCSAEVEQPARSEEPIHPVAGLPARPSGPVLDLADILPQTEESELDRRLRDLNVRTGDALVVVSVSSLDGESIENYAYNLFNTWGIGSDENMRGVLLLVAPAERKVRIEVGCGLEAAISDVAAGRIIRNTITPRYQGGDLTGGTLAGVDALLERLALPEPANDSGARSAVCRGILERAA